MKDIGVAVIGTGFMGGAHVEALRRIGVNVVGILGSSEEKSRRAAEQLHLVRAYANYEDVLFDEEVQSIHLGVPNRLHFEMAQAALKAGKHVLCEKPLAMNSEESAQLVELASQHPQLAAGVNYNIRFYPLCIEAHEKIQKGEFGKVLHVGGSYVQDWLLLETDYNWRVLAKEGGELRAVADIGTHWLDLITYVTGLEVEEVCADLKTVHPIRQRPTGEVQTFKSKVETGTETELIEVNTEDYGGIMLRFCGGARGMLWVSQTTAGRKNCLRFEIAGSQKSCAWDSEKPNELWLGHRERANEILLRDPSLLSESARTYATYPGGHNEGYADSFKQCFAAFYSYVKAGDFSKKPPYPVFADGHREIVLCEAILKSHQSGGWVKVS